MQPADEDAAAQRRRRLAYYAHVAEAPGPRIVVIEDIDPQPGFGAFWARSTSNIHKGLGCLGVITNGSIRDLPVCAEGFQMLAGVVGPSHAYVHLEAIGGPVTVAGMPVKPGRPHSRRPARRGGHPARRRPPRFRRPRPASPGARR